MPILLLAEIVLVGCQQTPETVPPPRLLTVNVLELRRTETTMQSERYFGKLQPRRERLLGFSLAGELYYVSELGQNVQADEVLAQLDVRDLNLRRQDLESQIAALADPQQAAPLQSQLVDLNRQIRQRTIFAPFDCIVTEVFIAENGLCRPQTPVLRVIDASTPQIEVRLPTRIVDQLQPDQEVLFGLQNETLAGTLAEISPIESAGSTAVTFDIQSDLSERAVRYGQTVEAQFNFATNVPGYWVPLTALDRSVEGLWSVLAVDRSRVRHVLARKQVTVQRLEDQRALIDGDLDDQQWVVADGLHRVVPGQVVVSNLLEQESSETSEPAD